MLHHIAKSLCYLYSRAHCRMLQVDDHKAAVAEGEHSPSASMRTRQQPHRSLRL